MTNSLEIVFAPLSADLEATSLLLAGEDMALGGRGKELDQRSGGAVAKAAEAAQFKGKRKSTVELLAPPRLGVSRLVLLGTGKGSELKENDWALLGGSAVGAISARKTKSASIIAEAVDTGSTRPEAVAALIAFGALLRHYEFRKYLTKQKADDETAEPDTLQKLVIHCENPDKARAAFARHQAVADGVVSRAISSTSRPTCWVRSSSPSACASSTKLGVEVEMLDEDGDREARRWARCWRWRREACAPRAWWSCSGTAPNRSAPSRSPSSARACASTPAASPSSRRPAWRT